MNIADLRQLYLAELQEARSFEDQIARTLGGLAERASDTTLKDFLSEDVPEARNHEAKVTAILEDHGAAADEHEDQTMSAILAEAQKWADRIDDPAVRDAALIASAQRIQHYEIAVYGSLAAWAKQEELENDLRVLVTILNEEKQADETLSKMAKGSVNREAA